MNIFRWILELFYSIYQSTVESHQHIIIAKLPFHTVFTTSTLYLISPTIVSDLSRHFGVLVFHGISVCWCFTVFRCAGVSRYFGVLVFHGISVCWCFTAFMCAGVSRHFGVLVFRGISLRWFVMAFRCAGVSWHFGVLVFHGTRYAGVSWHFGVLVFHGISVCLVCHGISVCWCVMAFRCAGVSWHFGVLVCHGISVCWCVCRPHPFRSNDWAFTFDRVNLVPHNWLDESVVSYLYRQIHWTLIKLLATHLLILCEQNQLMCSHFRHWYWYFELPISENKPLCTDIGLPK